MKLYRVLCLAAYLFIFSGISASYADNVSELSVFYSPSCHKCVEVKNRIIPQIEKNFKGTIKISYYDTTDINNYKLLLSLQEKYNSKFKISYPVFFMEGNFFKGNIFNLSDYERFITLSLANPVKGNGFSAEVNLLEQFRTFKPYAVISAGLIDGINPCAFTVIVFFISFLALQGYRKPELLAIGLSFIFSVFLTYILIGLGIFGFLYRLREFSLVSRIFNLCVGMFSVLLGFFALYDFLKYKKTKTTDGLILQLPEAVKRRIHSIIGMHYRRTKEDQQTHIIKLLLSALITGFLVSILEAVCTGQVYIPTITFVLKTTTLKFPALAYLLLYNFMFITPLLIIFVFSLLGATNEQFANILKKHLLTIKALMVVLFFSLGMFLIWRG